MKERDHTAASLAAGELTEAELEELLERTERDPEASADLDLVADLLAASERRADELERGVPARIRLERTAPRRWPGLAAAAAVLFGALAWFSLSDSGRDPVDPASLADRSLPAWVAADLRGADGGGLRRELERAMEAYAEGWHQASVRELGEFLEAHPDHGSARFYRAASLEALGRLDEARRDLVRVEREASGTDDALAEHARWRLVQLDLVEGEVERARERLSELAGGDADFAPNARELLRRLER